jgi:hypothetical protein
VTVTAAQDTSNYSAKTSVLLAVRTARSGWYPYIVHDMTVQLVCTSQWLLHDSALKCYIVRGTQKRSYSQDTEMNNSYITVTVQLQELALPVQCRAPASHIMPVLRFNAARIGNSKPVISQRTVSTIAVHTHGSVFDKHKIPTSKQTELACTTECAYRRTCRKVAVTHMTVTKVTVTCHEGSPVSAAALCRLGCQLLLALANTCLLKGDAKQRNIDD